ncbi:MAG: hypothetical protein U9R73_00655 [Pseudomonadota bacterium]|nr:hypothetical protein [Pseudomonadota bacterium]
MGGKFCRHEPGTCTATIARQDHNLNEPYTLPRAARIERCHHGFLVTFDPDPGLIGTQFAFSTAEEMAAHVGAAFGMPIFNHEVEN